MANVLITGFQRIIHRTAPVPVGASGDKIQALHSRLFGGEVPACPHRTTVTSIQRALFESAGTQQFLGLAIDAVHVLRVVGLMTIDEIDTSFHPILTAKLIGLFQAQVTNSQDSQFGLHQS